MIEQSNETVGMKPIAVTAELRPLEAQRRKLARIKRAIRRRTNGDVQELAVELRLGILLLRGRCPSFYCKQVAQQTAMHLVPGEEIINEIEVAIRPR
jgi:osmotically-inducible protein OsmY